MPSFGCLHLDNYGNNLHFFLGDLLHLTDHFFCNHRLQMLMHGEMFTCSLIVWNGTGTANLGMQEGVCQPIRMIHGALDRPVFPNPLPTLHKARRIVIYRYIYLEQISSTANGIRSEIDIAMKILLSQSHIL